MKLFIAIFNLYMLCLTCIPCKDDGCSAAASPVITAAIEHPSHHPDADSCTPFCTCSCCQASIGSIGAQAMAIPAPAHKLVHIPGYASPLIKEIHFDFWQPPRIG